jgi:hypothetical protein
MEGIVKLLFCAHCGDIVRLFPEKRSCLCGKSWGQYLEDGATTLQTYPGLSVSISNPDFEQAFKTFLDNPHHFSPLLSIRSWINPLSEADVKFVREEETDQDNKQETPQSSVEEEIASEDADTDTLQKDDDPLL